MIAESINLASSSSLALEVSELELAAGAIEELFEDSAEDEYDDVATPGVLRVRLIGEYVESYRCGELRDC